VDDIQAPSANYSQGQVINVKTKDVPIMDAKQVDGESDNDTVSSFSDAGDEDGDEEPWRESLPVEKQQEDSLAPPQYHP